MLHTHKIGDTVHYRHGDHGQTSSGQIINVTPTHVVVQPTNSAMAYKIPHHHVTRNFRQELQEAPMTHEKFMHIYHKNEDENRHMQNVVHLAKHYGTPEELATAQQHLEAGRQAGHNVHVEKNYALHHKLYKRMLKHHATTMHESYVTERPLTSAETEKKEEIVHKLKPQLQSFKSRYGGDKGKSVMYAVATKQAKKLAESEQLDELKMTSAGTKVYNFIRRGTRVRFPHAGQMKVGKVVGHDSGEKHGSPFYVIDHGEPESAKVPIHKVQLNELKKTTLGSYVKKAASDLPNLEWQAGGPGSAAAKASRRVRTRVSGIQKATDKLMKESEQLEELTENNVDPKKPLQGHRFHYMSDDKLNYIAHTKQWHSKDRVAASKILDYRKTKLHKDSVKEEVEQLGELKKSTMSSYIKKAAPSLATHSYMSAKARGYEMAVDHPLSKQHFGKEAEKAEKKTEKREKGIQRAAGKLAESRTFEIVKNVIAEMTTRKHFQQVADIIKAHPDAEKRKELAHHHAAIFAKQNPRFDHKKFFAAAGVPYSQE